MKQESEGNKMENIVSINNTNIIKNNVKYIDRQTFDKKYQYINKYYIEKIRDYHYKFYDKYNREYNDKEVLQTMNIKSICHETMRIAKLFHEKENGKYEDYHYGSEIVIGSFIIHVGIAIPIDKIKVANIVVLERDRYNITGGDYIIYDGVWFEYLNTMIKQMDEAINYFPKLVEKYKSTKAMLMKKRKEEELIAKSRELEDKYCIKKIETIDVITESLKFFNIRENELREEVINKAFREKIKTIHPDTNKGENMDEIGNIDNCINHRNILKEFLKNRK